jgi:tRNA-intron endonuclease
VKARYDGQWVRIGGKDGRSLHEQGGFGRPEERGIRLAPEEALYLLHRGKIEVADHSFDSLLATFSGNPDFMRCFLVYRDIRERGYIIQPGPHDFRVYRRGERPGTGRSQYSVRVIAERALIDFRSIAEDVTTASHMRKAYILAVVDDEDELTYYGVKLHTLPAIAPSADLGTIKGGIFGTTVIVTAAPGSPLDLLWIGTRLDPERLMLSPVETGYLLERDVLSLSGDDADPGAYRERVAFQNGELPDKTIVYTHLRDLGYTPRTAYKFGHHFRVYSGQMKHSDMLVHAIRSGTALPMSVISRSVRLAHSVRKKMLFACVDDNTVQYIEFSRIKL